MLTISDLKKVVYALISSHLYLCNLLYSGLSQNTNSCFQLIKNAAARLWVSCNRWDHVTSVLAFLLCLPVSFSIDFNIILVTFKSFTLSWVELQTILQKWWSHMNHRGAWHCYSLPEHPSPNLSSFKSFLSEKNYPKAFFSFTDCLF